MPLMSDCVKVCIVAVITFMVTAKTRRRKRAIGERWWGQWGRVKRRL